MSRMTILVVEGDENLRITIEDYLTLNGFDVWTAADGYEAVRIFENYDHEFDLVVLDDQISGMAGYEVLTRIRRRSSLPVIVLSDMDSEEDQMMAYASGASSYMVKPVYLSVLKAQIRVFLKLGYQERTVLHSGSLSVNMEGRRFYLDGKEIETTPKEYEMLLYLMKNENIVLDRNTILDNVWGHDYFGNDRTVDTIVKQLRKKLTDKYHYIKSVYGVGYYFEASG